jgi:hypothetical protein
MADGSVPGPLYRLAVEFADELTSRVQRILPTSERFTVLAGRGHRPYIYVGIPAATTGRFDVLPLTIKQVHVASLLIKYHLWWDSTETFLAVEKSLFHVRPEDEDETPLLRFEYLRNAGPDIPSSHVQFHAHRDELTYLLVQAEKGRPARRWKSGRVPRIAEVHVPQGGHRYRPCVEDVLHSVITEFGVDTQPGWLDAVRAGREEWRRKQFFAAARDVPQDAVEAVRRLGCGVILPAGGLPPGNVERLRAF